MKKHLPGAAVGSLGSVAWLYMVSGSHWAPLLIVWVVVLAVVALGLKPVPAIIIGLGSIFGISAYVYDIGAEPTDLANYAEGLVPSVALPSVDVDLS